MPCVFIVDKVENSFVKWFGTEQDKELLKHTSIHPSQRSKIHMHTACARHAFSVQCFNLIRRFWILAQWREDLVLPDWLYHLQRHTHCKFSSSVRENLSVYRGTTFLENGMIEKEECVFAISIHIVLTWTCPLTLWVAADPVLIHASSGYSFAVAF